MAIFCSVIVSDSHCFLFHSRNSSTLSAILGQRVVSVRFVVLSIPNVLIRLSIPDREISN